MAPREQQLIIILADISGYTRFIVENEQAAIPGLQCISYLIEAVLREADIPLHLQEIEGDAVFLYAAHDGDERIWQQVLAQVRSKLVSVFDAFRAAMAGTRTTLNQVLLTHLLRSLAGISGPPNSTTSGANIDCGLVTAPTWTGVGTKCNQNLSVLIGFFGIP